MSSLALTVYIVFLCTCVILKATAFDTTPVTCTRLGPTYKLCGENKCCCNADKAVCVGLGKKQSYIPILPATITQLEFYGNFLPNVSTVTFYNITHLNLTSIMLSDNHIYNISRDVFSGFPNLCKLDLSRNNKMDSIDLSLSLGSIQKSQKISLVLKSIGLKHLNNTLFQAMNRSNLISVSLIKNEIEFLNFGAFESCDSLKDINLAENKIRQASEPVLLKSLENLNLYKNEIAKYPPSLCSSKETESQFPKLTVLGLTYNYISDLDPNTWNCLKTLNKLLLTGNLITDIPNNVFSKLESPKTLSVGGMRSPLNMLNELSFNSSSLTTLHISFNNIQFSKILKRNSKAIRMFQYCNTLTFLDLSKNVLRRVSGDNIVKLLSTLRNLQTLIMRSTRLTVIPSTLFAYFPNLTKLNLEDNKIHNLENVFNDMKALRYLSLEANDIKVIQNESLPINIRMTLHKLNLAFNPFACDCKMLWFRDWIEENKKSTNISLEKWPQSYTCVNTNRTRFNDFHPTTDSCRYHDPLTVAYIAIGSFVVTFTLVFLLVYRHRWYVRYAIYKLKVKRKTLLNNMEACPLLASHGNSFDGYVIYNDDDSTLNFVHHSLKSVLEDQLDYKLHIWHRDADTGAKLEVMVDAIYASNHTIAIISKNFLKDPWCQFQLHVALDRQVYLKRDSVILVVLGDIDVKTLSNHWCVVLTKTPTAHWHADADDIRRKVFEQTLKQK